eukprot:jgi/Mesen1/5241/ME000026S04534
MAVSVPVVTFEGEKAGEAELGLRTARPETAKSVVHRGVITELQNRRRGTASTLTRSEVRGGGRKPYKQKGSGNARRGSQRTPLRPGGGVVFGPKPCDWTIKINKKEKQLAISTALQSASVSMTVVEDLNEKLSEPKTKVFVEALARWGIDYKKDYALLFTTDLSENVFRASKNIQRLKVITPRTLNLYDILRADKLIVTKDGLEYLNDRYPEDEYLEEEFEMEAPLDVVEESSEESEESEEEPEQS